jgi:mono/diheme cytochrome c family protein
MRRIGRLGVVIVVVGRLGAVAQAADAVDGKALFESKCAMCHGKDGVALSMAKGAANFNDSKFQEANTAKAIEATIASGTGKHRGLKDKLNPEQISAIAAHVKTLK